MNSACSPRCSIAGRGSSSRTERRPSSRETIQPLRRAGADCIPAEKDPDEGRGSGRADGGALGIGGGSRTRSDIRATSGDIYSVHARPSTGGKMEAVSTRICMLLLASVALSADTWTVVAPLPDATWRPSAAATGGDGLVYAIGGLDGSGPPSTNRD